ncbi:ATP-binding protein [Streptomyces lunaelactis]|uniref:ATP-binding protein n=1 Tax=Streptomyces lunaelactis TaxID=1535768 RepID=UPI0020C75224|nr:ATP-binding protein [Streptomyces lunaelactis]
MAVNAPLRQYSFSLPAEPVSVPRARAEAAKVLADWGLLRATAVVDVALLALSELVTNCVQHAATASPITDICLAEEGSHLVVAVHDRDPNLPRARLAPHVDDSSGRGLRLVEQMTAEAGGTTAVPPDPDGGGKTVTVRLPL